LLKARADLELYPEKKWTEVSTNRIFHQSVYIDQINLSSLVENCHVIYFILTTIYENRNILSSETKKLNSKLDLTGMDDPIQNPQKFYLFISVLDIQELTFVEELIFVKGSHLGYKSQTFR
jgi:hypothetical protein